MRPEQKSKSRAKLWGAIDGVKEITGAAGVAAVGYIDWAAGLPLATETFTIGAYVFEWSAAASDVTTAGTAAAPYIVQIKGTLPLSIDELIVQMLAASTTGAWGYLYPDDSVALVNDATDRLTITFWPGTWANSVVLDESVGDAVFDQPGTSTTGVDAPVISSDVALNILDTTGSTTNQEWYTLADGDYIGHVCNIMVKTFDASDTPTVLGHFEELGSPMVEMEFITGEPGVKIELTWTGSVWEITNHSAFATIPDFTAA